MDLFKELEAILAEKGVDEETTKAVLAELQAGEAEKEEPAESEPNPEEGEAAEAEEGQAKGAEEKQPEATDASEAEAERTEPEPEPEQPKEAEAEEGAQEAVAEAEAKAEESKAEAEEYKKALEALTAKVESLEQALADAGVLAKKERGYGLDKPFGESGKDDELNSFIRMVNSRR